MPAYTDAPAYPATTPPQPPYMKHQGCAVSWQAVLAGSLAICSVSFMLFLAGSGLGLLAVSPWTNAGVSAKSFTALSATWLIIMQWLSAALGGYLAGRLRRKWTNLHTHEGFFRDTAHGFLSWSLATLFSLCLLTSAATGFMKAGQMAERHGPADHGGPHSSIGETLDPKDYEIDRLFRMSAPTNTPRDSAAHDEAARILARGMADDATLNADKPYLSQLVVANAGISPQEAEQRVNDTIGRMQEAKDKMRAVADDFRKGGAWFSFYACFAMLIGAFIASAAGALGGRHRDDVPEV